MKEENTEVWIDIKNAASLIQSNWYAEDLRKFIVEMGLVDNEYEFEVANNLADWLKRIHKQFDLSPEDSWQISTSGVEMLREKYVQDYLDTEWRDHFDEDGNPLEK
jgi:hypothetical protein